MKLIPKKIAGIIAQSKNESNKKKPGKHTGLFNSVRFGSTLQVQSLHDLRVHLMDPLRDAIL